MAEQLVFTIPQAAAAAQTGKTTLYAEIKAGRLRYAKVGRKTLIRREALFDWLARCERGADAQVEPPRRGAA